MLPECRVAIGGVAALLLLLGLGAARANEADDNLHHLTAQAREQAKARDSKNLAETLSEIVKTLPQATADGVSTVNELNVQLAVLAAAERSQDAAPPPVVAPAPVAPRPDEISPRPASADVPAPPGRPLTPDAPAAPEPAGTEPKPGSAPQPNALARPAAPSQPIAPSQPSAQSQGRAAASSGPASAGETGSESVVVGVEGAGVGGTYLRMAGDLAEALDGPGLRIVPISGQGSIQNLEDLLHLPGVDLAIVQADALASAQREHLLPSGAEQAIQYISKLYDKDVHVLAAPDIHKLDDLKGKMVNADAPRSDSALTARFLFNSLGIPVTLSSEPQDLVIERLERGEIAALVRVGSKPMDLFQALPAGAHLHFLTLPQDDEELLRTYAPVNLTHEDYPNLVTEGEEVNTLAVGAVLAVHAWPPGNAGNRPLTTLVQALFARFHRLEQPPMDPKWQEVNLAADARGWTRFAAVADALARASEEIGKQEFARFLAAGPAADDLTQGQRTALLQQFIRWRRGETP